MAGRPAGRAYAPQGLLAVLCFQFGPPLAANLCCSRLRCRVPPPPLPAAGPGRPAPRRGGGAGGGGTGLRTLQAPECLLVGVRHTAREATRQAVVRRRQASSRGAGQACRAAGRPRSASWFRGPQLAREGGVARRGGRMPGYSGLPRRPGRGWGLGRKLLGGPRLRPHQLAAELGHQRVPLFFASLRTVV